MRTCAPILALCLLGVGVSGSSLAGREPRAAPPAPRPARSAVNITPISVNINEAGAVDTATVEASCPHRSVVNLQGVQGVSHPAQLLVLLLSPHAALATAPQYQVSGSSEALPKPAPVVSHTSGPSGVPSVNSERSSLLAAHTPYIYEPRASEPAPPPSVPAGERRARNAPYFPPVEDSQLLLQQFRAQVAQTPFLPPVVTEPLVTNVEDEVEDVPEVTQPPPLPVPAPVAGIQQETREEGERCARGCRQRARPLPADGPPPPLFDRSMMLKAVLTVHRADFSKPYTVWWDAASGASRIDYYGGSASTYRTPRQDGRVQSVLLRVDRTGETDVRRCVVAAPRRVSLAMRALPVLPDLSGFHFAGYVEAGGEARAERWRQTVRGAGGEREALTYRHELIVARAADNYTATPLRYAVAVDSSLLGDNVDTYSHRFLSVETRHHDPAMFRLDIGEVCEQIVSSDDIDLVEPLHEYTLLQRDNRYDDIFQRFKTLYARRYADELEEAVRKNVLTQSSRFVSSGNLKGASFELEENFLSDRLRVEKDVLFGAVEMQHERPQRFPHSADELQGARGRLPAAFDWRPRGAVTPPRYQDTCSSCWAFSVVGAVEGALFVETGRLVPLSEQTLVDCSRPYGTNGCGGSWPDYAYNYVQDRGLPALDTYAPYAAKEQECKADRVPVVTRISGYVNVTSLNIVALKVAIQRHGPTIVLLDAKLPSFESYKKGYYYDAKCKKTSSNHAMLAVGWTVRRGETYFILKNWWSTAWGDEGYMHIRATTNTCGVLRLPTYPVLQPTDVLRIPQTARIGVKPSQ